MEIIRKMNVSLQQMDDSITKMVLEDIKNATGKKVKSSDIGAGYKYQKELNNKMGKTGKVTTRIDVLKSGFYQASFESVQGTNTLSYDYKAIDDHSIELTYTEEFLTISSAKQMNYRLMNFLYKRSNKKRINLMLDQLEQYILQQ